MLKLKMKFLVLCAAGIIAASASVSGARAAVLYSQDLDGTPSSGGYFSHDGNNQRLADQFSIAGGGAVNQVTWYGAAYYGLPFSAFTVQFYANNAGVPGTSLGATSGAAAAVDTGLDNIFGNSVFLFTLNIPSIVFAPATPYWISIYDTGPVNFIWSPSDSATLSVLSFDDGVSWSPISGGITQAFSLSSVDGSVVPLPAALPLFATGLGALGLLGWRRKRKSVAAVAAA